MNAAVSLAPQGSLVTPRELIKIDRANAHPGQTFWVTNSTQARQAGAPVMLARSGKNSAHAKAFSAEDADKFFTVISG